MAGFAINRGEISRMMEEIQREFDKHTINIPVKTDLPAPDAVRNGDALPALPGNIPPGATIYNAPVYTGPVIFGDANSAQLAWGNQMVNQSQNKAQQIAPGFEPLAQAVAKTMDRLPAIGLSEQDQQDAQEAAKDVLAEVTKTEPNQSKIRRALSALKWFLTPVATGAATGAGEGAQELAKTAVEHLGRLPF